MDYPLDHRCGCGNLLIGLLSPKKNAVLWSVRRWANTEIFGSLCVRAGRRVLAALRSTIHLWLLTTSEAPVGFASPLMLWDSNIDSYAWRSLLRVVERPYSSSRAICLCCIVMLLSLDHGIAVHSCKNVGIPPWMGRMHAYIRREASSQAPGNAGATMPPAFHEHFMRCNSRGVLALSSIAPKGVVLILQSTTAANRIFKLYDTVVDVDIVSVVRWVGYLLCFRSLVSLLVLH